MSNTRTSWSIPTIDFQDLRTTSQQSHALLQAAMEWGFFRLVNHLISPTLLAEMKGVADGLLDLPEEIKRRNIDVVPGSGYLEPKGSLVQSLGIYNTASVEAVEEFCSLLEVFPLLKETIVEYTKVVRELAMEIGRKLCQSVGLEISLLQEWGCLLRMNKYRFKPETVGSSRFSVHTDTGFLTILYDDERINGLDVMDESSGTFVTVDPLAGSLLVILGDMAKVWSNGRFCNARHRVSCKEAATRISIALFVLGPEDEAVEAPPELVDDGHPRLFIPFKIHDYRDLRVTTGKIAGELLPPMHNKRDD